MKSSLPPLPPLMKSPANIPSLSRSPSNLPPISEAIASISKSMQSFKKVERKGLSGIKDVDLKILSELNDRDLFSFCLADKAVNKMCKDENFWRNRFVSRFGQIEKPDNWRNYYLKVVSILDKYSKSPWNFFDEISWMIGKDPKEITYNSLRLNKMPEHITIPFKFLELGKEVKLYFPIDRYGELDYEERVYKSERNFTPEQVVTLVYNFYQEPITKEEYEKMVEEDIEGIDEYSTEDVQDKKVKHIDLMHSLIFFEGFDKFDLEDGYVLKLGS